MVVVVFSNAQRLVSCRHLELLPIYATLAFRRVYDGSIGATIAKELGIGAIYAVVSGLAFVIMIYWVSIATRRHPRLRSDVDAIMIVMMTAITSDDMMRLRLSPP